jgi:hypothetical protein
MKKLVYSMTIWHKLRPFGIFYSHLVYIWPFGIFYKWPFGIHMAIWYILQMAIWYILHMAIWYILLATLYIWYLK